MAAPILPVAALGSCSLALDEQAALLSQQERLMFERLSARTYPVAGIGDHLETDLWLSLRSGASLL